MDGIYGTILKAIGIFLFGGVLSLIVARIARTTLGRFTSRTKSDTDDFILNSILDTLKPFGWVISGCIGWTIIPINNFIDNFVLGVGKLICLILIVRLINKILDRVIKRLSIKINDNSVSTMLRSLGPMIRAIIWCIGSAFYLQNIGVQMAAIWALLSAGGIGAGLALKQPVEEFFEYITILLDKPFQNGQFINIEGIWATVERVGVRSTRLRSINGEVIVMSNSSLTNGVISNYAEMDYRRIVHKLGVVYETPHSKMVQIPGIIKSIIESTKDAVYDRCHFIEFGSFSLDFEFVFYVETNDYIKAMEIQQLINLEIMRSFEKENIEFAFPTQTLNLNQKGKEKIN